MSILKAKNILPTSPTLMRHNKFPQSMCVSCLSKLATSMNNIIPKVKNVSSSDLPGLKHVADKYWPFPADDYFKVHPSSVEESEGEISTFNQSSEIDSQLQTSIINPTDSFSEETNFGTEDVVVTPSKSEYSSGNEDIEGLPTKNTKRYISGKTTQH